MALSASALLDSARLLFDLQHVSKVVQAISGCLEAPQIAQHITDALVEQFDCVFARLWLMEPDQTALRLVASSGLHTHINGSFARVPVGAYKVGKIAQNRVPFLSNHLADESWVKDRDWAIANHIQGFAGYPLITKEGVIAVLATFSDQPMAPEFLEVLQVLCMITTIALDAALQIEQAQPIVPAAREGNTLTLLPLSDQMAAVVHPTCLTLMGTEQPLPVAVNYLMLQAADQLNRQLCNYCRLSYRADSVVLEAIVAVPISEQDRIEGWTRSHFGDIRMLVTHLGGQLDLRLVRDRRAVQFCLEVPHPVSRATKPPEPNIKLSEREWEVMTLLAQGLRDRDIAQKLYISESTVKFHINNSLTKLNAKNRYQGVYQAAIRGYI